ncbi:hypothetical protein EDEG_01083 [Edhazardia aedis USNM 41457]|uniref:Uncharacterized protein n=1 Tax=Edhazardia aedis (strain USNM 41457) TaxID=1003232 RepID=J9DQ91_EDHAE|nr:hypothetical protein EDEG_01083 [Edhazardia aedis USNM 41457]|eukprot:EJW04720.1 hypothetical protein EDEG_01083 [Edhazardia aedis USNM 41457]
MIIVPQVVSRNFCKLFNKSICAVILLLMLIFQMMTFSTSFDINRAPKSQNIEEIKQENNTGADLDFNNFKHNLSSVQQHHTEEIRKNIQHNDFLDTRKQFDGKNNDSTIAVYPNIKKDHQILSNPIIQVKVIENQMNLDTLLKKINDWDESILYENNIDNLFDELSDIDLFDEMFYYKLKLFKLILHSEYCKSLFKNVGLDLIDEEAISIIEFSKNHLRMKELYNKRNFVYKKENWRTLYCIKQGIKRKIISDEASFYKENYYFLTKFSGLFKLYWQKKFDMLNNYIKKHNISMDLGRFYNINQYNISSYELKNVNFSKSFLIPIITHPEDGKIMAFLNLHSLDERHFQKLFKIKDHLQTVLNSIFKHCNDNIVFDRLFSKDQDGNKLRLTKYGEAELTLFSQNIKYIINEALVYNNMLSESDLSNMCKFYGGIKIYEKPLKLEEDTDLKFADEALIIDIWNWGLEKKCEFTDERLCDSVCSNQISVYIGLHEFENEIK